VAKVSIRQQLPSGLVETANQRCQYVVCLRAAFAHHIEPHMRGVVPQLAMAANHTQHEAADALFRAIIETVDRHRNERTLTETVLQDLASAYSAASTAVPEPGRMG
jgi:hypothetical protein